MDVIVYLIAIGVFVAGAGLAAFLWSLRSGQYDDLEGAAHRILFEDDEAPPPLPPGKTPGPRQ